jgi:Holliday junction resolvase RusA-like endonuclease
MQVKFTVDIKPVTKKNSGQIVMRGSYPILLPSKQYLQFEKDSQPYFLTVKNQIGVISFPINMQCLFYMDTHRKVDLCNLLNAVDDAMVKSGLIIDDNRDIIAGHDGSRVFYDKYNPRIEITITEIADYVQWKPTNIEQKNLFN